MKSSPRPNVLVFFTDQQRWDYAGLHGNPLDLIPNFDLLARAGTHVRHNFICQPVCRPHHQRIMPAPPRSQSVFR